MSSTVSVGHPAVSLLMAVYNASAFLPEALDSVLNQTMPDWELLCVDDCSTDDSLAILQEYAAHDSRIRVFHQVQNKGQAHARNLAIEHARGAYIGMLDADDWLSPDALAQMLSVFEAHPKTDAVLFTLIKEYPVGWKGESGRVVEEAYSEVYPNVCQSDAVLSGEEAFRLSLDWSIHGVYLTRASLHKDYPYDTATKLYSDDNTTHLHYLHSREVRLCPAQYHYRQHTHSATHIVGVRYFDRIYSNLSLRDTLLREAVDSSVLAAYESIRWLNYVDRHWYLYQHRHELTSDECTQAKSMLRDVYKTFRCPYRVKFGYTWFSSYRIFLIQEKLYFWLKSRV